MKRFFCNGKKDYCNRGNDDEIDCTFCEFTNGRGGKLVDCPDTNYERIRNMSIEEMAKWIAEGKFFKRCKKDWLDCIGTNCVDCQKEWLESEVSEDD